MTGKHINRAIKRDNKRLNIVILLVTHISASVSLEAEVDSYSTIAFLFLTFTKGGGKISFYAFIIRGNDCFVLNRNSATFIEFRKI